MSYLMGFDASRKPLANGLLAILSLVIWKPSIKDLCKESCLFVVLGLFALLAGVTKKSCSSYLLILVGGDRGEFGLCEVEGEQIGVGRGAVF